MVQNAIALATAAPAGSDNIKVTSVAGFSIGQKVIVDNGKNSETAIIAVIGTTGGTTVSTATTTVSTATTTVSTATTTGVTVISVANVTGFSVGQTIEINDGSNRETAVVASITAGRQNFGGGANAPVSSITVSAPLKKAHAAGVQVSGSGVTLASPLAKDHNSGTQIASNVPTPGEPNQFARRP